MYLELDLNILADFLKPFYCIRLRHCQACPVSHFNSDLFGVLVSLLTTWWSDELCCSTVTVMLVGVSAVCSYTGDWTIWIRYLRLSQLGKLCHSISKHPKSPEPSYHSCLDLFDTPTIDSLLQIRYAMASRKCQPFVPSKHF